MNKSHISWLSQYIQIDTTPSAGNEEKALRYMQELAERNGLLTLYIPTGEKKGNLLISLREEELLPFRADASSVAWTDPPIVLLSHVDVVEANAKDWAYPPFSGAIVDGEIWGRGAIDAKQIGMTHLLAMVNLKDRSLSYPILQMITCEEETGSENGLKAFLQQFPEMWEGALILNEGGGFPLEIEGDYFYLMETGQKGNASFAVTTSTGSSKNPYMPNNEVALKAFNIAEAIAVFQMPGEQLPPSVHKMFSLIAEKRGIKEYEQNWYAVIDRFPQKYQRFFSALTKSTMTVTSFVGGRKRSELSGGYRLMVDARPLPGTDHNVFKESIENRIHQIDRGATIEWHQAFWGYDQQIEEYIRTVVEKNLGKRYPGVSAVPFMTIGSNDGRYFQQAGAKVIGYCPMLPEMTFDKVLPLVHGVDERISIKDFEFGIQQMIEVLEQLSEKSILRG